MANTMTIEIEIEDASTWRNFTPLERADLFVLDINVKRRSIHEARGHEEIAEMIVDRMGDNPEWKWQLRVFTVHDVIPNRLARLRLERSGPWSQFPELLADTGIQRVSLLHDYDDGTTQALGYADVPLTVAYFGAVSHGNAIGVVRRRDTPSRAVGAFGHEPVGREKLLFESVRLIEKGELVIRSYGAFDDRAHGFQFFGDYDTVSAMKDVIQKN